MEYPMQLVCSAHAEVIPLLMKRVSPWLCLLRTRGGDPDAGEMYGLTQMSAPHTRR